MQFQIFFQKNKKEIIIASVALIVFSVLIYFVFFNNKNNISNVPENNISSTSNKFTFSSLYNYIKNIIKNNSIKNNNEQSLASNENNYDNYYQESLIKIWEKPVAGYNFYYKNTPYSYTDADGKIQNDSYEKTFILFVDSATGYIYQKDLTEPTSTPIQITTTSIPNIRKAYFLNNNDYYNKVIMQYSSNGVIKTIIATIPDYFGVVSKLINIQNLPDNITNISTSDDNNNLVYLVKKNKSTNGSNDLYSDWYKMSAGNSYGQKIYSSELSDWKLITNNSGDIYSYNTESARESSGLYKLNFSSNSSIGKLQKVYGDHTGMSMILGNNNLLTSIFTSNGLKTFINNNFNGNNFTDNNLSSLNFNTLSNKCTINEEGGMNIICSVPEEILNYNTGLPDAWYQGFTTWKDKLYIVNQDYPNGQLLFDINIDGSVNDIVDGENLKINKLLTHVLFINKNDSSLWSLNINNILNTSGNGD